MTMTDEELELVANKQREMTQEERDWAINQHDFLYEYVRTQDNQQEEFIN